MRAPGTGTGTALMSRSRCGVVDGEGGCALAALVVREGGCHEVAGAER